MSEEQAVVDQPDPESQETSADGGSAQDDDLDSLLNQWESASGETEEGEQSDSTDIDPKEELKQIRKRLEEQDRERAVTEANQAVQEAASHMRNAVSDKMDIPEEVWDELLHGRASKDSRVYSAFMNRAKDKARWNKTIEAIAKDFVSRLHTGVDKSITEGKDAVQSAVASASKSPPADDGPKEKDLNNMSDAEFEKMRREMLKG